MNRFGWRQVEVHKERYLNERTDRNRETFKRHLTYQLVGETNRLRGVADQQSAMRVVEHTVDDFVAKAQDFRLGGTFTNHCVEQIMETLLELDHRTLPRLRAQVRKSPFVMAPLSQNMSRIAEDASVPVWYLLECLGLGRHKRLSVFDEPSTEVVTAAKSLEIDARLVRCAIKYAQIPMPLVQQRSTPGCSWSYFSATNFEDILKEYEVDSAIAARFAEIDLMLTGFGLPAF